jgi:hypothetical protein
MLPVRSRELVEEFLESKKDMGCVDVASTGRNKSSIYAALHAYLKRNASLNVEVRMHNGDIILAKIQEHNSIL